MIPLETYGGHSLQGYKDYNPWLIQAQSAQPAPPLSQRPCHRRSWTGTRARPARSEARSSSQTRTRSGASSFSRSSASTVRPKGAITPNSARRHPSRWAVPSPPSMKSDGLKPHAANTSLLACAASETIASGGLAPKRFCSHPLLFRLVGLPLIAHPLDCQQRALGLADVGLEIGDRAVLSVRPG